MEGTTVNAKDKIAYSAMSYIQAAMTNGSGGIAVKGPNAGIVYALNLKGGQSDTRAPPSTANGYRSTWLPCRHWWAKTWPRLTRWATWPIRQDRQPGQHQVLGKTAHPVHRRRQRPARQQLPVGLQRRHQDADAHPVDAAGAESTGLHAVDDINGFAYMMSNFQHPGDWEAAHGKVQATLDPLIRANYRDRFGAAVGYLTGLPTLS
jgi:hypothetical protein